MNQYVKKPIVIEAIRFSSYDDETNIKAIAEFMGDIQFSGDRQIIIKTLEGDLYASEGDYIIKGIRGEFYPCKPDIFEASYDYCTPTQCKPSYPETFHFGSAISAMKDGHKVARKGWNGKGLSVELQIPSENSKMTLPYLFMNYPATPASESAPSNHINAKVPWLASQTDMLAEDWVIIDGK